MNRGPFIFIGLFIILSISWAYTLNKPQLEGGNRAATGVSTERIPHEITGLAAQGKLVYQELGCIACHTQQIRFASGNDIERGWGDRQTVAQDYIDQAPVLLGNQRIGPDLTNIGARRDDATWLLQHLYNARITTPGSNMPSYSFLFDEREVVGQPSNRALELPAEYAPEEGIEIVPTRKADALVAYMLSLNIDYDLDEAPSLEKVELK